MADNKNENNGLPDWLTVTAWVAGVLGAVILGELYLDLRELRSANVALQGRITEVQLELADTTRSNLDHLDEAKAWKERITGCEARDRELRDRLHAVANDKNARFDPYTGSDAERDHRATRDYCDEQFDALDERLRPIEICCASMRGQR